MPPRSAGKESLILTRRRHKSCSPPRITQSGHFDHLGRILELYFHLSATIVDDLPIASQRSSIRDYRELMGDYTHMTCISALFCLSTYSGNFLVDDQFLTNDWSE
jgi:hypothetical protein